MDEEWMRSVGNFL